MRIQNNISALNTHRMYKSNNSALAKNVEKLSSGYRINRAGDDAAGLAISEKMRGQIRGLNMASKNSQDAISLIQTAEGALQSSHDILQRMRELAVQAASDTNNNSLDREALNLEYKQLAAEIDDIASKTDFNTRKLLDGTAALTFQVGANYGDELAIKINNMNTRSLGAMDAKGGISKFTISLKGDDFVTVKGNSNKVDGEHTQGDGTKDNTLSDNDTGYEGGYASKAYVTGYTPKMYALTGYKIGSYTDPSFSQSKEGQDGLHEAGDIISGQATVYNSNLSTQHNAANAISITTGAINIVSMQRAALGAWQNRLEYKITNLDTTAENLQAAESQIRDVDMASEMTKFMKNQILSQASTAMLAQANSLPQNVLSLIG